MRDDMKRPELLMPAKDLEVLKTAVRYGADAVYIGGEAYGLRAKARNFSHEEMAEGIRYAHEHGVKVFVTANILAHNSDLAGAEQYFGQLAVLGPDAILVADPGMFMLARKACPKIPIHISTQANNTKARGLREGTELKRDRTDSAGNPRGQGDRGLRTRRHVHFLLGTMPSVQLFYGTGRQPGRMHPPLPLEIRGHGGVQARRVPAGGGE